KLLRNFHGSGHSTAAGAKVEGVSIEEAKSKICRLIGELTHPGICAKDIMSFPVKTVSQEETVNEAYEKLKRFECKGAPVTGENNELVGMITLGDMEKALKNDMGHSRVKGYMARPLVTAAPDTPLYELKRIVVDRDKGRIPVIEENKLVGIITRTDVLRKVHGALLKSVPKHLISLDVSSKLKNMLPKRFIALIDFIGKESAQLGMNVFLVGGFVRDLFLNRKNYDLDIVVEGDAIKFGKVLADKMKGSLVVHRKFGTSTVVTKWPEWLGRPLHEDKKFKIDVATARRESYKKPAALPTVKFSSLKDDLYRRDFTINAMAISINKQDYGLFIDFFGGLKDIESGTIRVLHDKSFIDDPTRIFRAVRFEQRFGFAIESHTEYLIKHAVKLDMIHKTENQRIRDELILIFKEDNPEKAVFRMKELHELRFIHPKLVVREDIKATFKNIDKCMRWYHSHARGKRELDTWLIYFMAVLDSLTKEQVDEVLEKFVFTRGTRIRIRSYKAKAAKVLAKLSKRGAMRPSEIYNLLEELSHEVTLCILAKSGQGPARRRIEKFFTSYNGIKVCVKGGDVIKMGVNPGPHFTKILHLVLCKKIDGGLKTKKDEFEYLKKIVSTHKLTRKGKTYQAG
ncbi:MAG: CBS domain-containing protein, partial [Candidatus Omnitrophica bacterium]|nr:CBS domain-containing protein [Candidatus Omnitrophota bacterium]